MVRQSWCANGGSQHDDCHAAEIFVHELTPEKMKSHLFLLVPVTPVEEVTGWSDQAKNWY